MRQDEGLDYPATPPAPPPPPSTHTAFPVIPRLTERLISLSARQTREGQTHQFKQDHFSLTTLTGTGKILSKLSDNAVSCVVHQT